MNRFLLILILFFIVLRFSVLGLLAVILNWSLVSIYLVGAVVSVLLFSFSNIHFKTSRTMFTHVEFIIVDHDESA